MNKKKAQYNNPARPGLYFFKTGKDGFNSYKESCHPFPEVYCNQYVPPLLPRRRSGHRLAPPVSARSPYLSASGAVAPGFIDTVEVCFLTYSCHPRLRLPGFLKSFCLAVMPKQYLSAHAA
jgi:hypothetical protein